MDYSINSFFITTASSFAATFLLIHKARDNVLKSKSSYHFASKTLILGTMLSITGTLTLAATILKILNYKTFKHLQVDLRQKFSSSKKWE